MLPGGAGRQATGQITPGGKDPNAWPGMAGLSSARSGGRAGADPPTDNQVSTVPVDGCPPVVVWLAVARSAGRGLARALTIKVLVRYFSGVWLRPGSGPASAWRPGHALLWGLALRAGITWPLSGPVSGFFRV